ncbi:MAG: hypothetical protein ACUVRD_08910 [Bacteroidia bacterium]
MCSGWEKYIYEMPQPWDETQVANLSISTHGILRWKDFTPWGGKKLFEILTPENHILRGCLGDKNLYVAYYKRKLS